MVKKLARRYPPYLLGGGEGLINPMLALYIIGWLFQKMGVNFHPSCQDDGNEYRSRISLVAGGNFAIALGRTGNDRAPYARSKVRSNWCRLKRLWIQWSLSFQKKTGWWFGTWLLFFHTHMLHVWNIYQHLPEQNHPVM